MRNVVPLCHEEGVRLDVARLATLVAAMGESEAEGLVNDAMEEMALRLSWMEQQYLRGETGLICREARRLCELAEEVGMVSFARVAEDVLTCAGRGDMVAFAATWARLTRIGDRSLSEVWDLGADSV